MRCSWGNFFLKMGRWMWVWFACGLSNPWRTRFALGWSTETTKGHWKDARALFYKMTLKQ